MLTAERAVVAVNFAGSAGAYRAALAQAGATVTVARAILGDELRRLGSRGACAPGALGGRGERLLFGYPDVLARAVRARPAPWWLGGRERGSRSSRSRPAQLFTMGGGSRTLRGPRRDVRVDVLGDVRPLGTIPFPDARGSIAAALRAFARRAAFESWTIAPPGGALKSAICRADDFPVAGTIRLSSYVPFLALAGSGPRSGRAVAALALAELLRAVERVVGALEEADRVIARLQLGDAGREAQRARLPERAAVTASWMRS